MQVQNIQKNNTNFGYNSLINARIMNDLANSKKNIAYYNYLRDLCSLTNQTELKLREAERRRMPELTGKLMSVFLPIKYVFTEMIDAIFPNYNYKNIELETYADEISSRGLYNYPDHWLNVLVQKLQSNVMQKENAEQTLEQVSRQEIDGEDADEIMNSIIKKLFPGATIVSATKILPETNSEGMEGTAALEETEEDEDDFEDELGIASGNSRKLSEEDMIKLGKSRVIEYKPEGKALKGFDGLGGMKKLKAELQDKVVDFLKDPAQAKLDAEDYGTKLPKGILLYGPPGCGKTTVAKHLSVEAGVPMLKLETGNLKTSYYHETSKNIDAAFAYAASIAKPDKPVIMLIDDGDSFFVSRNERTTQFEGEEMTTFLNKIQEAAEKNIMVVLTTNKYDIMDPAIRRRFDTQVYVGLPDEEARISLLQFFLSQNNKGNQLANDSDAINRLAKKLEGFPISAIEDMTNEAFDIPRRESKEARKNGKTVRRNVSEADFNSVIDKLENQNKKIKESLYKTNATREKIGFSNNK